MNTPKILLAAVMAMSLAAGCGHREAFEQYVIKSEPAPCEGEAVPKLTAIPQPVLGDARQMALDNKELFEELVVLYLLKYERYYLSHFNQGYSLLNPDESGALTATEHDDRFFMLRAFSKMSGYRWSSEDGFPDICVRLYAKKKMMDRARIAAAVHEIEKIEKAIGGGGASAKPADAYREK